MYEDKEQKNYKYDAFISYRHTELDSFVAEKIQKYLENFKLPKNIKGKYNLKKTKIERVFRDKEELTITNNLEDPIIQALKGSEYLIVVCSPRTKESIWCRKEIEKFIEFHGRSKILTVLIEGEPSEAFPEELLFEEEMVRENGISTLHRKDVEPLAADIRGKSKREMYKLLKAELLRVIAPIFGLEYDDLRQRHRERKIKRVIATTIIAAVLGGVIGIAGIASALIINNQKEQIEQQKAQIEINNKNLLYNQANNLADKSLQYLAQDRREEAVETALSSVTEYEGIKMPYTALGKYSLTKALRAYDIGESYIAQKQLRTKADIYNMVMSNDRRHVLAYDKSENVYLWDVVTGELKLMIEDSIPDMDIEFFGESMLVYANDNDEIKVVDFLKNEEVLTVDNIEFLSSVKGDETGKYIAILWNDKIEVYNLIDGECICQLEAESDKIIDADFALCGEKIVYIESKYTMMDGVEYVENTVNIADINSEEIIKFASDIYSIDEVKAMDGVIFINGDCFDVHNEGEYGCILALDENNGQIIWQNRYKDTQIVKMYVTKMDGEFLVFAASYGEMYCIDGNTGAEKFSKVISEGIADFTINTEGIIYFLSNKGSVSCYYFYTEEMCMMEFHLQCNVETINKAYMCENGYIVLPINSEYIIKYEKTEDKEPFEITEDIKQIYYNSFYTDMDPKEEAKKIEVPNPELVERILYIEDGKIALITYLDMNLDIYDVEAKKVIKTIKDIKCAPLKDFGKDKDGTIYVMGEDSGYCFDEEYNLITEIDNMVYVDTEEKYVLVGYVEGDLWKIPIYSLDDLIEMAKELD